MLVYVLVIVGVYLLYDYFQGKKQPEEKIKRYKKGLKSVSTENITYCRTLDIICTYMNGDSQVITLIEPPSEERKILGLIPTELKGIIDMWRKYDISTHELKKGLDKLKGDKK